MKNVKFNASNVMLSVDQKHPNKLKFSGTIAYIDTPSDGVPCGVDKPLVLRRSAVEKSIDTLNLMPINCEWDDAWSPAEIMTNHDMRGICGVIEKPYIQGEEIKIDGIIYQTNFPDLAYFIKNAMEALGFSVEGYINELEDDDKYCYANSITFTGVSMLFKNVAAFKQTYIDYIAAKNKNINTKENDSVNEEQLKELFGGFMAQMKESIDGIKAELSAKVDEANTKVEEMKVELAKAKESMKKEMDNMMDDEEDIMDNGADEEEENKKKKAKASAQPERKTVQNNKVTQAKLAETKDEINKIWASACKDNNEWYERMTKTIEFAKHELNEKKIV